jgi:hypothetical protein
MVFKNFQPCTHDPHDYQELGTSEILRVGGELVDEGNDNVRSLPISAIPRSVNIQRPRSERAFVWAGGKHLWAHEGGLYDLAKNSMIGKH